MTEVWIKIQRDFIVDHLLFDPKISDYKKVEVPRELYSKVFNYGFYNIVNGEFQIDYPGLLKSK